jgi:hypothetical protein
MTDPALIDDGFEPDERALCPDDACIGVLDGSGRCKVCGSQGAPPVAGERAAEPADSAAADSAAADSAAADSAAADSPAAALADEASHAAEDGDDFADRRLCTDPSCIGVLDTSGHCKECGRDSDAAT